MQRVFGFLAMILIFVGTCAVANQVEYSNLGKAPPGIQVNVDIDFDSTTDFVFTSQAPNLVADQTIEPVYAAVFSFRETQPAFLFVAVKPPDKDNKLLLLSYNQNYLNETVDVHAPRAWVYSCSINELPHLTNLLSIPYY
jgi:hypothetical protein